MTARERRARLLSILLLATTLAAGVMLGRAWSVRAPLPDAPAPADLVSEPEPEPEETDPAEDAAAEGEERGDGERRNREPVIYEVGLEASQRESVDRIITHFRERSRSLNREMRDRYDREQAALFSATRDSLRAVLNPEQIVRYDSLLAVRYGGEREDDGGNRRQRRR